MFFSGIIVDRVNRKWLMVVGDMVCCSTIVLLALLLLGQMQIWHIYVAYAINQPFDTCKPWPANQYAHPADSAQKHTFI